MSSMPPPSPAEIVRDARWLAQALDAGAGLVRLIAMDRESYRAASFLDDRMLQQPVNAQVLPWSLVAGALPEGARQDARWIFHIGHVGSTLVARLLGEIEGVLSVREPRVLRDAAELPASGRAPYLGPLRKLLSRTFSPEEIAVVKATSFVGEIADELVAPGGRALFLYAAPRAYIGTIIAGPNSVVELQHLAAGRARRLEKRVAGVEEAGRSGAHLAAAAWACEMTALERSAEAIGGDSLLWMDFDRFLAEPALQLAKIAAHFGIAVAPERLAAIAAGPLMRRYSKALEYEYSSSLRGELIDEALAEHRADVEDALAMLSRVADKSPLLRRALDRCERG